MGGGGVDIKGFLVAKGGESTIYQFHTLAGQKNCKKEGTKIEFIENGYPYWIPFAKRMLRFAAGSAVFSCTVKTCCIVES